MGTVSGGCGVGGGRGARAVGGVPRGVWPRRGTALPFVLAALVIGLIAVGAAASVVRAAGRGARAAAAVVQAGAAADGALAELVARWPARWNVALVPGTGAWREMATAAGPARVRVVRLDAGRFALEAEARSAAVVSPEEGAAVRRRMLLVRLRHVAPPAAAAVTAGGPVALDAGAVVDGADAVPNGWADCLPVAGGSLAVAAPEVLAEPGADVRGVVRTDAAAWAAALDPRFGDAPYAELAAGAVVDVDAGAGPFAPVPRALGGASTPGDAGAEPCALDAGSWGEPRRGPGAEPACEGALPVVHLRGRVARLQGPARFQGTLLVDGDLEIEGLVEAAGMVVVRGAVQGAGALVLDGRLVAGGGVRLAGGSRVRASACAAVRAAAYAARAGPLARRAWAEVQR